MSMRAVGLDRSATHPPVGPSRGAAAPDHRGRAPASTTRRFSEGRSRLDGHLQ